MTCQLLDVQLSPHSFSQTRRIIQARQSARAFKCNVQKRERERELFSVQNVWIVTYIYRALVMMTGSPTCARVNCKTLCVEGKVTTGMQNPKNSKEVMPVLHPNGARRTLDTLYSAKASRTGSFGTNNTHVNNSVPIVVSHLRRSTVLSFNIKI